MKIYRDMIKGCAPVRDQDFSIERCNRLIRVRADGHSLTDNEGTALGCVIHLRDITDRTLMEERIGRMERFLSLATLASGLHHEIKNPLTALSIHVQLLEETLLNGQSLESASELVGVLKTEVYRLNGVLETFKSFANLKRLAIQPTDVLAVVNEVIRLIKPQAAEHHVEITLHAPPTEIPPVPLDPEKFEQALLNLVINGLEAMPDGGELKISALADNREVRVSVEDAGPGMPLEVQQNLFQPYFTTKATGTGIGLALSEKLISQHGGRIDYSTSPVGSTFHIVVPLQQAN
jgi:signal transduction histidine kinase